MTKTQRIQIATATDSELEKNIDHYSRVLSRTGRHLGTIRRSINAKLQAYIDEQQTRMLNSEHS